MPKRSGSSVRGARAAASVRRTRRKIDYSDIPESSRRQLKAMRRVGRPPLGNQPRQLIAIRVDEGARVDEGRAGLRAEPRREVALERDARMRARAIPVDDDEAGRLRLDLLPTHRVALFGRERALKIARERVE